MIRSGDGFDVSAGRLTVTGRDPPTINVVVGEAVAAEGERKARSNAKIVKRDFTYFFSTSLST
jgi:hypothetical protein